MRSRLPTTRLPRRVSRRASSAPTRTSENGDQEKIETTDQATIDGLDASQWTEKGAFEGARKELEGVDIDIDIVDIHRREELDGTRCG